MWTTNLSDEDLLEAYKESIIKGTYNKDIEDEIKYRCELSQIKHHKESYNQGYEDGYEDGKTNCGCNYSCEDNCQYKDKFEKLKKAVRNLEDFV